MPSNASSSELERTYSLLRLCEPQLYRASRSTAPLTGHRATLTIIRTYLKFDSILTQQLQTSKRQVRTE